MARVVVIGGHGKVALHLERILSERGDEVTALIRNPDHAADIEAAGARPQVADVENMTTDQIADVLRGHDAVVWSAGAGGGNPERTYAVDRDAAIRSMDAATAAGVRRYVMVSYIGSRPDHGVPEDNSFFAYADAKAAADEYLRANDLEWTVLGPGTLTVDAGTGLIEVADDPAEPSVSREDVAAVVAATLVDPGTVHRTIPFNNGTTPIADALHG